LYRSNATIRAVPRILLMGYFGADNFGDDALLADWLLKHETWLRERNLVCDVLSQNAAPLASFAEGTRLATLIERTFTPRQALRLTVTDYAGLIAPGGSLLQDVTSLRSLLFYLWVVYRFQRAGRPTCLLHQGLGPLNTALGAFCCTRVLERVQFLSVRDQESWQWLQVHPALCRHPHLLLSADPILDAAFEPPPGSSEPAGPYALLIPKRTGDLPYRGDRTSEAEALTLLCRHITAVSDLEVRLLPFHGGQDRAFCEEIAAVARLNLVPVAPPSGNAVWQALSQASLVVSHRLHGLVSAAAHGIPALGVAYDPKVSSFCDAAGYPWCFPALVHDSETLQALSELWNARADAVQNRRARLAEMRERLAAAEAQFRELW
jgi:polysaccharide pyruvyl transferase CsaB